MCITRDRWQGLTRWNWDGDHVIHECIVPSSRRAIGSRRTYDIDVREFLLTERNEVMRRTIHEDLRRHVARMPDGNWERFQSRARGAFDYRVTVIADFVAEHIAYPQKPAKRPAEDPWQFPDETLVLETGDCEDRALLIASLLLASGISSFHIRVALGKLVVGKLHKDHAWVMYKSETGEWMPVDPPPAADRLQAASRRQAAPTEPPRYEPFFLFNDVHLWAVRRPDHDTSLREWLGREWKRISPEFHGGVHLTIIERALRGVAPKLSRELEKMFHRPLLGVFGPLVDDVDRMPYEPAWHFDNGYIDEGWDHVARQLALFRADQTNVKAFAIAAHAIADFYAHSNFCHLAEAAFGPTPRRFAMDQRPLGGLPTPPDYTKGDLRLDGLQFSWNGVTTQGHSIAQAAAQWRGKLISGRYAQFGESPSNIVDEFFLEGPVEIPKELTKAGDFWKRGILPHHDEIAVDEPSRAGRHLLYKDKARYARQFVMRRDSAIEHVRAAFLGQA
jgi:hypothetical protein